MLCYRLRARHGSALDFEYILPVESGDDEIPREDWVMLITLRQTNSRRPGTVVCGTALLQAGSRFKVL